MKPIALKLAVSACTAAFAIPAQAQQAGESGSLQLEEVVVTAQKREQNVQDVPLAVAVVSAAQIERAGAREFADLQNVSPSLQIRGSDQPINASVALRGIGTFAFSIGVEPSVAVQVDDVPVAFQSRAFADLTDVERIEVLRGPQSTLYGKSTSAGLINITTAAPTDEFTAKINLAATSDEEYRGAFSLSGPIGERVGYRLTASRSDFAGNVKNIYDGKDVNGKEETTVRGKLDFHPTDALEVLLTGNYVKATATSVPILVRLSPNARLRGDPALSPEVVLPGLSPGEDNLEVSMNTPPQAESKGLGGSLKVSYNFGNDYSLTSISAYDDFDLNDRQDVDRTSYAGLVNFQGGNFGAITTSQEFRLQSPSEGAVQYTLGLFYGNNDLDRRFQRGPVFSLANWYATSESTVKAVFGQGDWEFVPKTFATIGARWQDEDISYTFNDIQNGNVNFAGSSQDEASTYRLGLRHEFTDDFMLFGSYATGHKGQTYDLTTGFNAARAAAGPVNPEESKSMEVGIKSTLFDRRLMFNVTAFHVKYEDFQQQGIETIGGTQNFRLTNVGTVKTQGLEVETDFRAAEHLRLNAAVAYVDAKIDEFPFANCYPGQTAALGCTGTPARQDLGGSTLPSAPKFKANLGWDWRIPLGSMPFDGALSGTYMWVGKQNFSLNQDPQTEVDSYSVLNLVFSLRSHSGAYTVSAFVNNALDEGYFVNGGNQFGNFGNQLATDLWPARDFERYAGIRASFEF